jgi:predicted nucleic acid-binding protein
MGPVNWYFDTSVLVPAAVTRHPHNAPALAVLEELVSQKYRGYRGYISAHSLTEVYSVLTRTPFKPPLYPSEAWQIIEEMILPHMELVTLTPKEYQEVVRHCAISGWAGGKVHDAVHLRCAQKTNFDRLYTFNVKDFRALAPDDLRDRIAAP